MIYTDLIHSKCLFDNSKQVKKVNIQTAPVHTIHNVLIPDERAILLPIDCITLKLRLKLGVG